MEEVNLTPGVEPGGRVPVACSKDRGFPTYEGQPRQYFFRTNYGCDGKAVTGRWAATLTVKTEEGFKSVKYFGYGSPIYVGVGRRRGITDLRTLTMTAAGCCPPELMTEFLQQEDTEKDAVEEAVKLHKVGYFGGGG